MIDPDSLEAAPAAWHGQSPAGTLRDLATKRLREELAGDLKQWRDGHAATPDQIPPPPSDAALELGLNPFWWSSIKVRPTHIDVVLSDFDPLTRLRTPYPAAMAMMRCFRESVKSYREWFLREEAKELVDLLADGDVRLEGVRNPVHDYGGGRIEISKAELKSRLWELRSDDTFLMEGTLSTFSNLTIGIPEDDLSAAVLREAQRLMEGSNGAPARVQDVVDALRGGKFKVNDIKAEYRHLPQHLRRDRGQSDRTLRTELGR
jgi:hypothetical protein